MYYNGASPAYKKEKNKRRQCNIKSSKYISVDKKNPNYTFHNEIHDIFPVNKLFLIKQRSDIEECLSINNFLSVSTEMDDSHLSI